MIRRIYQRRGPAYPVRVLFSGSAQLSVRTYAEARGCVEVPTWREAEVLAFQRRGQRLIVIPWGPGVLALVNAEQHYKRPKPHHRGGASTGAAVEV